MTTMLPILVPLLGVLAAALGLIKTVIDASRKTNTKLDKLETKAQEIHVLVNGNLTKVQDELRAALERVRGMEDALIEAGIAPHGPPPAPTPDETTVATEELAT